MSHRRLTVTLLRFVRSHSIIVSWLAEEGRTSRKCVKIQVQELYSQHLVMKTRSWLQSLERKKELNQPNKNFWKPLKIWYEQCFDWNIKSPHCLLYFFWNLVLRIWWYNKIISPWRFCLFSSLACLLMYWFCKEKLMLITQFWKPSENNLMIVFINQSALNIDLKCDSRRLFVIPVININNQAIPWIFIVLHRLQSDSSFS